MFVRVRPAAPSFSMHPSQCFKFCPSCGTALPDDRQRQPLCCPACGLVYYFNTTCATAAIVVRPDGMALFIRRAKEPRKGALGLPGGFIDEGETAEDGVRREFTEEVGFAPVDIDFLCSHPNTYDYKGITYPVLDFFFVARATGDQQAQALDAVDSVHWLDPMTVGLEEIAFPSMKYALTQYRERRNPGRPGFLLPGPPMHG
ncbi:MAG: nudC [Verrucomicrobiales bacterium]|nr:nudC [Verrucomicrobiales bacterium]